jgi:hypothetical protein
MALPDHAAPPGIARRRSGNELPATAGLFLSHLASSEAAPAGDRFDLGSGE